MIKNKNAMLGHVKNRIKLFSWDGRHGKLWNLRKEGGGCRKDVPLSYFN